VAICWQPGQIGLVSFEDQNCKLRLQCCGAYVDPYHCFYIKKIYTPTDFGDKKSYLPKNTGAKGIDSFMWDTHGVHAGQHSDMKIKLDRNNHTFINKK
jgi:hypothetical protein